MVVERGRSRATASARSRKSLQIPQPPPPPTHPPIRPSVLPFKNHNWMWFQLSTIHSRNTFEIWRSRRAFTYLHLRKSSWFALHLSCTNDAISPFTLGSSLRHVHDWEGKWSAFSNTKYEQNTFFSFWGENHCPSPNYQGIASQQWMHWLKTNDISMLCLAQLPQLKREEIIIGFGSGLMEHNENRI